MRRRGSHRSGANRKPAEPARKARLMIDALAGGGDGVATLEGQRIFVPFSVPGDVVDINVQGSRGQIIDLIKAGPSRISSLCKHFGECGGCSLQHLNNNLYKEIKTDYIRNALHAAGITPNVLRPIIQIPLKTRRRAVLTTRKIASGVRLGFHHSRSSYVSILDECHILHPHLMDAIPVLEQILALLSVTNCTIAITLCNEGIDAAISSPNHVFPEAGALSALGSMMQKKSVMRLSLNGETILALQTPTVSLSGYDIPMHVEPFLQASVEGENELVKLVLQGVGQARKVADLFSGCGTFSFPVAAKSSVVAFEKDDLAINTLKNGVAQAQRDGKQIKSLQANIRNLFQTPLQQDELNAFDAVIFDPPRSGALAQVASIARSDVPAVVGVSCNPKSFARDAKILIDGGYDLTNVTPVDQFTFSSHIELVGAFRKKRK